ncbi:hypothetical protein J2782_004396 [Brucella pseudogrignonensis]|uniref:Uncharacterized protein n=1 Tax=Brucella pseudogrignonensis TaxID=419475 RepID=A0ABU1MFG1_9HYPH|nr:hypothetical protein [Brucella pseudogrignonensis]
MNSKKYDASHTIDFEDHDLCGILVKDFDDFEVDRDLIFSLNETSNATRHLRRCN